MTLRAQRPSIINNSTGLHSLDMEQHRYTVHDIDEMRRLVHNSFWPWSGDAGELAKRVERKLRTYILAGITPEQLQQAMQPRIDARDIYLARTRAFNACWRAEQAVRAALAAHHRAGRQ